MLKIYGHELSWVANKVRGTANALGLEYEYVQVDMMNGANRKAEYLSVNPFGKVPAIDDEGFKLFESDAIQKYLCSKKDDTFYPKDPKARAAVDQWCGFIAAHLYTAFGKVVFNKLFAKKMDIPVDERSMKEGGEWIDKYLPNFETQLGKTKYLAGDELTIADFSLVWNLDPAEMIELDLKIYPKLWAYREELRKQDWYQKVHKFHGEEMMAAAGS